MIKVTSKIGSHKRAQSFAIVRPDSVGCPTRMRSVCPLRAALGTPWLAPGSTGFSTARKHSICPAPGWLVLGRVVAGVEKERGGAAEAWSVERGGCGQASRVVLLLPLQRLWALTGVGYVSTDVILRCQ